MAFDFQVLSTTLLGVVNENLQAMLKSATVGQPKVATKPVIFNENGNIEVSGFNKFHGRSYIAAINFYLTQQDSDKNKACGLFILYVRENLAYQLIEALELGSKNERPSQESILDACGELCNMVAGSFKNNISNLGFKDLFMSAPEKRIDRILEGIKPMHKGMKNLNEFTFFLDDISAIVLDVVLDDIPQK